MPNGVTAHYAYDADSQLTSMIYKQANGNVLGDLSYLYDESGLRIKQTGSFAPQDIPAATTQDAQIDANNRKVSFNGSLLSYDANGNILDDGLKTYTWNARNQLVDIASNGSSQLHFSYDAMGRRVSKNIQTASATTYLYDGISTVQETQDGKTNPILTGLGADERFARNDVTGRTYFLTDAINSTLALTDEAGRVRERYTYDPYGTAVLSDTATGFSNPYQYTGREADAADVYFYRARYYNPVMAAFLGEDPIGFAGGQASFYAYVGNDPLMYVDPLGLWSFSFEAYVGFGGGIQFGRDPTSGEWFYGGRLGVGASIGGSLDPAGKRPGADGKDCTHGSTVGIFNQGTITIGPASWNPIQNSVGLNLDGSGKGYEEDGPADSLTFNRAAAKAFGIGWSAGVEVVGH